jgi:hypothetical protein
MRYERDDSLSTAARLIRERICALPEFAHARSLVVLGAIAECRGADVSRMRGLGGFTEVVRRHIAALPEKFCIDYGSKLLPRTVVDTLRDFVPEMREEVQWALAEERRVARSLDDMAVAVASSGPGYRGEQ